jgi:peptidoglycan/xylan/chitin deacetylase (PgdA/CDA1 family)
VLALTFDDGPDPAWTPHVLDALDAAGALATFFVVAEQIEAPGGSEVLAETLRRGHRVQMHCMRHVRHEQLDLGSLRAEAEGLEDTLAAHGAPDPVLWRPPYGSVHPEHSCRVARERGRQLIRWSYDTVDYRGLSAARMLEFARDGGGPDPSVPGGAALRADSIVLMHDSRRYSSTPEGGAQGTVELVAPLVEYARERGWELGTLDERVEPAAHGADSPAAAFLLPCSRVA